ncbi:MAG: UDP-2,3-diacylglucosamine diphosphatase [Rhizobiales bacterium]|nr:UDP-2,3-diacylglucosamine diphosphatase [Rhizobacter sp.]
MEALLARREIVAPAAWRRIDFISDLHLADDTPLGFEAWRTYLLTTGADAVFILGDLFEAWVGDDARHAGFEARGAAVLAEAAARRKLFFMVGNRDFMLGAEMLAACGVEGLPDPTVLVAFGERALLTHGDAWCIADAAYQRFRLQVRNPAWQAAALARPLAERRSMARSMRSESERAAAEHHGEWVDVDTATALKSMAQNETPTLVHGHTHRPATEQLALGFVRHVLSDWELDHGETPRAEVMRWEAARWTRLAPADAIDPAA